MQVRAVGPSLAEFGVAGSLTAPRLKLQDASGTILLEIAVWGGSTALTSATAFAGVFPLPAGSADSAAVATLAPGAATVHLNGASTVAPVAVPAAAPPAGSVSTGTAEPAQAVVTAGATGAALLASTAPGIALLEL